MFRPPFGPALAGLLLLTACQHKQIVNDPVPAAPVAASPAVVPTTPPKPVRPVPRKVAVVLGPGGAKALAHVGFLKALAHERVPIAKIVGLEWGSLVAGLYAQKASVSDVEWKLYKMAQRDLPSPKGWFSGRAPARIGVMDGFLDDAFARAEVPQTAVAFSCPARNLGTGSVMWPARGQVKDAVHRCLPYPPAFAPEMGAVAAPSLALEAIQKLKSEGYDPIVLVDVLGGPEPVGQGALPDHVTHVILWQEIRRAIEQAKLASVEVVTVETGAYPVTAFAAAKELGRLGEEAGAPAARKLVERYGL